jgi:S1-C subfamily serine protease
MMSQKKEFDDVEPAFTIGAGVVVNQGPNKSLILTAAHVVDNDVNGLVSRDSDGVEFFIGDKKEIRIELPDGTGCVGLPVYVDTDKDLALVVAKCVIGQKVELGEEPIQGSSVTIAGVPLGIRLERGFVHGQGSFDGRIVSGLGEHNGKCLVTTPAVGGFSGSGVFYDGRLVGIVLAAHERYEHATLVACPSTLTKFFEDADTYFNSIPDAGLPDAG